ncbi:MAG: MarR family transcriptional regulator [Proteobacteria bacterium]|nr:MarR family transcriptional regulator [Pseudomonadota bacterium]
MNNKQPLRLWIHMLSCSKQVERELKMRLQRQYQMTLAKFDLLAILEKENRPLTKTELSQLLIVSNANVTGLVGRMIRDGFIYHVTQLDDRRVKAVEMTQKGSEVFKQMASSFQGWVGDIFQDLTDDEVNMLITLLNRAKKSIRITDIQS